MPASLGIAIADRHATPESLLRDSDAAMYLAKERGRGRIEMFDEALRFRASRRLATASALAPDIGLLIKGVLDRTGVRPGHLCLELTESVFMEDVAYFERTLGGLKALGVDLSIDDFGTGYSSLSYLKMFPVDGVKVDRVFVDGLGTDPHDTALVAAIVAMATALDLEVTAEGVETREQLRGLRALGVPRAQGFYLARPMPAEDITKLVAESHH